MSESNGLRKGMIFGYLIAFGILLVDQISKHIIINVVQLPQRGSIEIIPVLDLTWVENRGISLGMLTASSDAQRWMLVGLISIISLGVVWWITREKKTWDIFALGLVLGGAIGNLVDRIRYGYVADFIDLHFGDWQPFLVFNVADAAISIGVVILILRAFLLREKTETAESNNA